MKNNHMLKASSGNNVTAIIFLSIFVGVILLLIIVAFVGSIKDKREKTVTNARKREILNNASGYRVMLFSRLNKIVVDLQEEIKDFKPSVGTKSLGQINTQALDEIKAIKDSKELKEIYKSEDFKKEIAPIIEELVSSKPSNWEKEAGFALALVDAKFKSIAKNKDNKEMITKGETFKWN